MASNTSGLKLEIRPKSGSTGSRKVRHEGRIPGVLYGHGQPPVAIAVDGKALGELLHGRRQNMIDIVLDGANDTAIIRDMQLDPVTRKVMSIDFQRVSRSEVIHSEVAIVTVGIPIGVREMGGVLDLIRREVEVSGPADKIPEEIRIDVSGLGIHEHITAGDLQLPEGIKIVGPADAILASVEASRTEKDAEAQLAQATPEGVEGEAAAAAAPAPEGGAAPS